MSLLLAPFFALLAGALFGLNVHIQRHGLGRTDPLVGTLYSVAAMAGFFWLVAPFFVEWAWFLTVSAGLFALGGLVFPAAGQGLQIFSIRKVGPSLTAAVGSFVPFIAAIPAVLFLGEALGVQGTFAMLLMVAGLVLAVWSPRGVARGWPLWALALPLGAALARGLTQPVTKAGLNLGTNAIFATLVYASVSTVVILMLVAATGRRGQIAAPGRGARWFALSGVINGIGILCVNTAISLGDVTLVAPLVSTTPLWTVALAGLGLGPERPRPRHALVAIMVVSGAALLLTR